MAANRRVTVNLRDSACCCAIPPSAERCLSGASAVSALLRLWFWRNYVVTWRRLL